MKNKIKEFFDKSFASQEVLKRIAFYLLVICIVLILIFFKLEDINHNILLASGNYSNQVLIEAKDKNFEEVSDIFVSYPDESEIGDTIPLYDYEKESSTENTAVSNNNGESTTYYEESTSGTAVLSESGKINLVINTSSKKIHYADCSFVSRMKEENRHSIQLTKNELNEYINNGYTLCTTCGG